ncbi:hypothetical protein ACGF0D_42600 [Kitasatospora sp. NPDC048298]|uniref:hypothetical protein n=1 Tax=Kitasatospora sp. NPDC048298 TaxID=3364049 RepID=UPI0037117A37
MPGESRFEVRRSGPRRLWDELEAAHHRWESAGRPGYERYGLTVAPAGQTAWLDEPDNPLRRRLGREVHAMVSLSTWGSGR